jgi:catechol 1,2-dioxygenase
MSIHGNEAERALTEQVVARFANTPDARLRTLMQSLVRHLHAFVSEV